ncbi:hypothetical protein AB835_11720 [Candidatus Endobugula sertula]|uniref:Uncharacterized protein n=1 Tax=Candidatus Endobugula sertula TaxID=62101 RepID=A0A1D2QMW9_9GAMM|nr:hypothetical protein AB835_11720 [Candidatus Endobugula sertula]
MIVTSEAIGKSNADLLISLRNTLLYVFVSYTILYALFQYVVPVEVLERLFGNTVFLACYWLFWMLFKLFYVVLVVKLSRVIENDIWITVLLGFLALFVATNLIPFIALFLQANKKIKSFNGKFIEDISMSEQMRIKFLFIDMPYAAYIKMQSLFVVLFLIAVALLYYYGSSSDDWLYRNGWWLCLVVAIAEIIETVFSINKAKKEWITKSKAE